MIASRKRSASNETLENIDNDESVKQQRVEDTSYPSAESTAVQCVVCKKKKWGVARCRVQKGHTAPSWNWRGAVVSVVPNGYVDKNKDRARNIQNKSDSLSLPQPMPFQIIVQTLSGHSFPVLMESSQTGNICALKVEIEKKQGIPPSAQQLFLVSEKASQVGQKWTTSEGSAAPSPNTSDQEEQQLLKDTATLTEPCTVIVYVKTPSNQTWDFESPLITTLRIFELAEDDTIATRAIGGGDCYPRQDACLMTGGPPMEKGKHLISFKVLHGYLVYLGAVWDSTTHDTDPFASNSCLNKSRGWGMLTSNGGLYGHSVACDPGRPGPINPGQVLTIEADLDAGTLRFWRDGKRHGAGYTHGVTGPLRWAIVTESQGNIVQIVDQPELELWQAPSASSSCLK
jgi:hypothetical protein